VVWWADRQKVQKVRIPQRPGMETNRQAGKTEVGDTGGGHMRRGCFDKWSGGAGWEMHLWGGAKRRRRETGKPAPERTVGDVFARRLLQEEGAVFGWKG